MNHDKRRGRAAKFLLMAIVWIAFLAAVIWAVMLLWNWLMPALFTGARTIGYWQALGLFALCKILFGGGHGRWKGHWKEHHRRHHMSGEERDQLKQHFRDHWGRRCGWPPRPDDSGNLPEQPGHGDKR